MNLRVIFSLFVRFFSFFPQNLFFLFLFLTFFPGFQLTAVVAKNRTKRASINELRWNFLKKFLLLSN